MKKTFKEVLNEAIKKEWGKDYKLGCYNKELESLSDNRKKEIIKNVGYTQTIEYRRPKAFVEIEQVENEIDVTFKHGTVESYYGSW